MTHEKIKQFVDDGIIGIESYTVRREGGQVCGTPIVGVRVWFPKDSEFPDVDIRIKNSRSQYKNRETALMLLELVINP